MKEFFKEFSNDMIHQTQGENFIEYGWMPFLFSLIAVLVISICEGIK